MLRKVFTQLLLALAFTGVAWPQPSPPNNLVIGVAPNTGTVISGGTSSHCLTVVSGRLRDTPCVPASIVPPANGGTGTSTVFTVGSLVFAGSSGIYQQNNANIFWDNTNDRLGIGTAGPLSMLHIVGKGNSADGAQIDSTTQSRVMVNNTSGGASFLSSVVFAKSGTAKWTIENDASAAGTQDFNIIDNVAGSTRFQIDASGIGRFNQSITAAGPIVALNATSIPAGGTTGNGFKFSSASNFGIFGGSGAPTLSAAQGSIYLRSDGVPFYNNNGSTGWSSLAAGSGTVNAGTINQMAWYAGTGSAVSGLATANSGLLVTSGAGVPSIGTAIPNGVTATTQASSDNSTLLATTALVQAVVAQLAVTAPPIGVCLPYAGASAPSASWVLGAGQAISRTTFAAAFAVYGVVYGSGDGSTTFNVPDLRGRVPVEADAAGGTPASRITTGAFSSVAPGGSGGTQTNTAATSINSTGTNNINFGSGQQGVTSGGWSGSAPAQAGGDFNALTTSSQSNITITTPINGNFGISVSGSGTSAAFNVVQPSLVMNYICKVQ